VQTYCEKINEVVRKLVINERINSKQWSDELVEFGDWKHMLAAIVINATQIDSH